ncbi:MAG: DUF1598 domain-containing protein [Saprospiraceae bacterium]|nr:DUF1598 domain-containing protein [Saprospiraceae bacterium]
MKKHLQFFSLAALIMTLSLMLPFCNSSDDYPIARFKGEYLCISLARLMEKVQNTSPLPDQLDTLFGLSWLEGYVIDSINKDIVLVGKRNPKRSAYHFEDLLVNFQNVFSDSSQAPFCSLDPLPENMKKLQQVLNSRFNNHQSQVDAAIAAVGGQQVVVGGVPRNSRHANVMIFADYDMKKLSQGLIKMPGVRSTLEISLASPHSQSSMSRFWFHIKESKNSKVYPNFDVNKGIVLIKECPVIVLTEKQQADDEGNLSDQTTPDTIAETFAEELSRNFSSLTLENALFCDLENLFRLQACLRAMKIQQALEESAINTVPFFRIRLPPGGVSELPVELPGLVNADTKEEVKNHPDSSKTIHEFFQIVAGGVSQEMRISKKNLFEEYSIRKPAKVLLQKRPNPQALVWTVDFGEQAKNQY